MLLSKHHGLGNDFVVVLDERNGRPVPVDADLARRLCDRRRGIGADGLIHGAAPDAEQAAAGFDLVMVLFNSDGSRAEMSGNGVRCLGQAVARARGFDTGSVRVLTDGGARVLQIEPAGTHEATGGDTLLVHVDMGRAGPGPHVPDPVVESLPELFGTVDMGNPHLVMVVDDPHAVDLATEGAWLEAQFEHGVNVEFIAVDRTEPDHVDLVVWERGAGVTEACGTGACASAHLAHLWGLVGDHVRVTMPGGRCDVVLGSDDAVTLIGPTVWIADVTTADAGAEVVSA